MGCPASIRLGGSDKTGDVALAFAVAARGAASVATTLLSAWRSAWLRGLAVALVLPSALLTLFVGLLSLAEGELIGATMRVVASAVILALLRPALFPRRS